MNTTDKEITDVLNAIAPEHVLLVRGVRLPYAGDTRTVELVVKAATAAGAAGATVRIVDAYTPMTRDEDGRILTNEEQKTRYDNWICEAQTQGPYDVAVFVTGCICCETGGRFHQNIKGLQAFVDHVYVMVPEEQMENQKCYLSQKLGAVPSLALEGALVK